MAASMNGSYDNADQIDRKFEHVACLLRNAVEKTLPILWEERREYSMEMER